MNTSNNNSFFSNFCTSLLLISLAGCASLPETKVDEPIVKVTNWKEWGKSSNMTVFIRQYSIPHLNDYRNEFRYARKDGEQTTDWYLFFYKCPFNSALVDIINFNESAHSKGGNIHRGFGNECDLTPFKMESYPAYPWKSHEWNMVRALDWVEYHRKSYKLDEVMVSKVGVRNYDWQWKQTYEYERLIHEHASKEEKIADANIALEKNRFLEEQKERQAAQEKMSVEGSVNSVLIDSIQREARESGQRIKNNGYTDTELEQQNERLQKYMTQNKIDASPSNSAAKQTPKYMECAASAEHRRKTGEKTVLVEVKSGGAFCQ